MYQRSSDGEFALLRRWTTIPIPYRQPGFDVHTRARKAQIDYQRRQVIEKLAETDAWLR
jgi:hypothetical protein